MSNMKMGCSSIGYGGRLGDFAMDALDSKWSSKMKTTAVQSIKYFVYPQVYEHSAEYEQIYKTKKKV